MKVALLGTRHVHAEGLVEGIERLGATVIGAFEREEAARAAWRATPIAGDRDELLAQADAVIVAGTNRERVDDTIAATAAGLPVLTEKPVAADADNLARLLAEARPELVMVALPVRFSSTMQRARDAIRAGAIGTPLAARGTNHGIFPGGWFGSLDEAGGGALQDHVVHLSDGLSWLLDAPATRAYAAASSTMLPDLDVESSGVVTLDFASGLFASIDASWSRPQSYGTWGDVRLEIIGTAGRLRLDHMAPSLAFHDDRAGKRREIEYADDDMTQAMLQAFLDFARDGGPSPVSFAEGVHASDVVRAAYDSVASGQPEPITTR